MAGGNVAVLWRPVRSNGLENPRSPVQYLPGAYYWCCIKQWLRLFKAQLEAGAGKRGGEGMMQHGVPFCRDSGF